jgi:hypothetical protein
MGQQGGWHVPFTPDRVGIAALWFLPAGSTTASGTRLIASWVHEHARSVYAAIRG